MTTPLELVPGHLMCLLADWTIAVDIGAKAK